MAGLELKWEVQVKNEPKFLTALTAPVVATDVATPQGVTTLVYVTGFAMFAVSESPRGHREHRVKN